MSFFFSFFCFCDVPISYLAHSLFVFFMPRGKMAHYIKKKKKQRTKLPEDYVCTSKEWTFWASRCWLHTSKGQHKRRTREAGNRPDSAAIRAGRTSAVLSASSGPAYSSLALPLQEERSRKARPRHTKVIFKNFNQFLVYVFLLFYCCCCLFCHLSC